jgi:diaminobutyrate-2-oxoglutarate transaminase
MTARIDAAAGRPAGKGILKPAFLGLWFSETSFDFSTALMNFAMGIWVYQGTGSAEKFSLTILSSVLPALLAAPFAGALADGHDRRRVIVGCDIVVAALVILLTALLFNGRLEVVHLYAVNGSIALLCALRNPSYQGVVSAVVSKEDLTRAHGLIGFSQGTLQVFAPLAAGYMMAGAGLKSVMALNLLLVAAGTLAVMTALVHAKEALSIQRPAPSTGPGVIEGARRTLGTVTGYFKDQPLMKGLALYALSTDALFTLASGMITPLVLSTHSSETLGQVMTFAALGGMTGYLVMLALNLRRHLMLLAVSSNGLLACFVVLVGLTNDSTSWCWYAFICVAASSVSLCCANALWLRKLPPGKQGSTLALMAAAHQLVFCAVMVLGSFVSENLFEPALLPGGALADSVGLVVGTGKGRGLGLLYVLCGLGCAALSLLALAHPRLRKLDSLVQDAPV